MFRVYGLNKGNWTYHYLVWKRKLTDSYSRGIDHENKSVLINTKHNSLRGPILSSSEMCENCATKKGLGLYHEWIPNKMYLCVAFPSLLTEHETAYIVKI